MARLLSQFELEDPIDCFRCEGLYDLRFWRVLSDKLMQCPACNTLSTIEKAIELTRKNTEEWARTGREG